MTDLFLKSLGVQRNILFTFQAVIDGFLQLATDLSANSARVSAWA